MALGLPVYQIHLLLARVDFIRGTLFEGIQYKGLGFLQTFRQISLDFSFFSLDHDKNRRMMSPSDDFFFKEGVKVPIRCDCDVTSLLRTCRF